MRTLGIIFIAAAACVVLLIGCEGKKSDYRIGKELLESGDKEAAIAAWEKAVEKDPTDGQSWGKLGNMYMRAGRFTEAANAYDKATQSDPNEAKYYVRLAEALFRSTDFSGAIAAAQRGLDNNAIAKDEQAVKELKDAIKRAEMARTSGADALTTPSVSSETRETTGGGVRDEEAPSHECQEFPTGELSSETLRQLVPDDSPGRVFIRWRTETQEDNYGFNIHRGEKAGGPYSKVNASIIPGEGSTNIPRDYCYVDTPLPRGKEFYYYIESISNQGVAEIVEGTKDTKVRVKTVDEEREWIRKKAAGIDTRATTATVTPAAKTPVVGAGAPQGQLNYIGAVPPAADSTSTSPLE